jgi:hypothetical protein
MKDFRNKLEKNNRTYRIFVAVSILCLIGMLVLRIVLGRTESGSGPQSGMSGFFAAMIVVSLIFIKRNNKALNDDKLFKELYIRNTDERNNQISKEAGKTSFLITIGCLSVASLISDYFNRVVSATLSCCMGFIMIVYLGVTFYYNKKM